MVLDVSTLLVIQETNMSPLTGLRIFKGLDFYKDDAPMVLGQSRCAGGSIARIGGRFCIPNRCGRRNLTQ